MKIRKMLRIAAAALLTTAIFAGQLPLSASAGEYTPSPSPDDFHIISGTDDSQNDITDILVVTPYRRKTEMIQNYKQSNFDIAVTSLSWEVAEEALSEQLSPDMNPRNLTAEVIFYAHEKDDQGIVELPADIQIPTNLRPGDFCEVLAFQPRIGFLSNHGEAPRVMLLSNLPDPDHSDYEWVRIPSQLHDGYISLTVDHFGSYAVITYHATEVSDDPVSPTETTAPGTASPAGPTVPLSPQTGEEEELQRNYTLPLAIVAGILAAITSRRKSKR